MWLRSAAALLLGLPLSVALVALWIFFGPGDLTARTVPGLLMLFPVWVGACALAFWFRRGWHAWAWMGAATITAFALIHFAKVFGWVAFGSVTPVS